MEDKKFVPSQLKIKVVGLGGAGCNAVTRMIQEQIHGVEFIAMNTDVRQLALTETATRVQLGRKVTQGMGAGGECEWGRQAAEESRDEIEHAIAGADMVFITAGMGGGTGTGSAPIIADIARKNGALTIAFVTRPFKFEGTHRTQVAEQGITKLIEKVDALITVPNERLFNLSDRNTGIENAFKMADEVLFQGVKAITEVLTVPGLINIDFASIQTVLKNAGPAWMSIGKASGPTRATDAAKQALNSPLMDVSIEGATRALYNITAGENITLTEIKNASEIIQKSVDKDANIVFGVVIYPGVKDELKLTLIAAGFTANEVNSQAIRDKEHLRLLKAAGSSEELETPPFLRHKHN